MNRIAVIWCPITKTTQILIKSEATYARATLDKQSCDVVYHD